MAEERVLDPTEKQAVQYCVPLWLRDEQIRVNIQRIKDRIQPYDGIRSEPIAIVCYGPSLNDTWEKVKDFKYIMTCSGAHKFMIDRGVIPTWQVDVDPREHKVKLMGAPHPDVEYLICSTCHPKLLDHLDGHKVRLWHAFDSQKDAVRVLPRGEWAISGGVNVGLRCLTIARFFGFTEQHIFGMDGSEGPSGKHADVHPNQPVKSMQCEYPKDSGIFYRTVPNFLEAARMTWHELNQLKDVKATFYGEGLVQAMAKDYVRGADNGSMIAFSHPEVISPEYKELSQRMHRENVLYGVGGGKHAPQVLKLSQALKTTSILDYGCGKGYLAKELPFPIWEYDPAIVGKDTPPGMADIVICTDVLEHIEPEKLKFVLSDILRCMKQIGYFVIHTGAAQKVLPDGRNTHLIQKGFDWWKTKIEKFFVVGKTWPMGKEIHMVVAPRKKPSKHAHL